MSFNRQGRETSSQHQYAVDSMDTSSPALGSQASLPRRKLAAFAARRTNNEINSFSGAVAGLASGIATCPLDVIKTKLQAQGSFRPRTGQEPGTVWRYRGLTGTASIIIKEDGWIGLYRGLGPMLLGYLPTWATYMAVYGASKDYYYEEFGHEHKWIAQLCASITAGSVSTVITNPIWVVKTRLMSQVSSSAALDKRTPWHYNSTRDAFSKMYRHEGLRSFYSGLGPALLGLTHVAIQFPLYELLKFQFTGEEMGHSGSIDPGTHTAGVAAATFLSKVCATVFTYPHEVIRTRLQTQQRVRAMVRQSHSLEDAHSRPMLSKGFSSSRVETPRYRGLLMSFRTILKEEGWRAFYQGMGTNMIRAVPAAMVTMLTFETVKSGIQKLQDDAHSGLVDT